MTDKTTPETPAEVFARARPLLAGIAAGAARREAERTMPYAEIRRLAEAGLMAVRVPREHGGPGFSLREAYQLVIDTAAADSNIAQALRSHFGFVEGVVASRDPAYRARWFPRILAGEIAGLARGELGAPNGVHRTRLTRDGENWRINGRKFYTTGTLFAQWVTVSVRDARDEEYSAFIPTDREGVQVLDDWDGAGQRLTASGTAIFDNVLVHPHELSWVDLKAPRRAPGLLQLILAATQAGIVRNALADAVDYAKTRARPIKHALAQQSVDDPFIQRTVGELSSLAWVSEQTVLATADAVDRALQAEDDGRQDLVTEGTLAIARTQFFTTDAALRAGQILFDVAGASATQRQFNLDRHWRNARTLASHNPMDYKAQVLGANLLTGAEPPRNFF
ncbi:acyl-CoA dehydrogenase family protein [Xylophilus sp.]|uniref:acyl-CoA dehydrogenase family protein n=1 Tax=Xylophilus sp. TaxID=2653893 RepID=UPI0013B8BB03|nr:acyl-CoA dehydrogenase family protein [Xylophilus sp.]KAF1050027.1 MAG: Dibenzothiophene desulfurization enzyme C [Xylophilus sp.]